jgi:hypothetical protein
MFKLLRSKQSEDVPAMSIVQNKNSDSIEKVVSTLQETVNGLLERIVELEDASTNKFDLVEVDLSVLTNPQTNSNDFSSIVSSSVESTKTIFQVFVTYLGPNLNFTEKIFKLIHKDRIVKTNFIQVTSTSVIFNFDILIADLDISDLQIFIHN